MNSLAGWQLILPELILAASALLLLVTGVFGKRPMARPICLLAGVALAASVYFILPLSEEPAIIFNGLLKISLFTQTVKLLIVVAALLALVIGEHWLAEGQRERFEYPVLLLLCTLGLCLLVSANDLLSVYVAFELASLSMYVLAAFDRDKLFSTEAGLKYFILGSLASGMMLFGVSLIYGFSGTTQLDYLGDWMSNVPLASLPPGLLVGMVLVIIGFCFKLSAVPFHMWTPDVYQGAPTPVVALFATAPKVAMLAMFIRVLAEPFGVIAAQWQPIVAVVALASMMVGAFGGLVQTNIKRLIAYSSIGHVGYALVGLAAGTAAGIQGVLVYLGIYVFMSAGLLAFVLLMRRQGQPVEELSALAGLSKTCPKAALFVAIVMFSMAGIPPLAGFFGKMYVFLAAVQAGWYWLAIAGVLTSVVGAYYYLRIVKLMYFDDPTAELDHAAAPLAMQAVMVICAIVMLGFFLWPTPMVDGAREAAASLAMVARGQ